MSESPAVMQTIRIHLSLTAVIIALVLGGCAAVPPERAPLEEDEALEQAQRAEQRGDYEAAARTYMDLAARASELKRAEYQLQAAAALLHGNYIDQARRILDELDVARLHANQLIRTQLLSARIALAENHPEQALDTLRMEVAPSIPATLQARRHELRADAYRRIGNLLEAARERVKRGALIEPSNRDARAENRQEIWQTLMLLSEEALTELRLDPPPDVFSGWLELARIAKLAQRQPTDVVERIATWRELYPAHPASEDIVALVLARQQEEIRRPEQIAVLLPAGGRFSELSEALRDGIIAAHYNRQNRSYQPTIRIYDIDAGSEDAVAVYRRAIEEGADFVVGPLRKESVNAVIDAGRVQVPTLTLNYSDRASGGARAQLFQFGLAPEDEARQVAERAWLDGHNHALAIVPEGEWGQRMLEAFRRDWEELGGTLLEAQTYPAENSDFSPQLKRVLNLDESARRHRNLEQLIQRDLKYEPRRRQDTDFVYMAAFPRQARLIRPQLKFHYASQLPVYSTSHIYGGHHNRQADRDMDDVIFCDIPWVLSANDDDRRLKRKVEHLWPDRSEQYIRFYALGIDAYNIIPYLNNLRNFRYERYTGNTGVLHLGDSNRIFRRLQWAQFRGGLPRPYN